MPTKTSNIGKISHTTELDYYWVAFHSKSHIITSKQLLNVLVLQIAIEGIAKNRTIV